MQFQQWYVILRSFHSVFSVVVLMGQTYFLLKITFIQSAPTKTLPTYLNFLPLVKICNRREVSGGDIKYMPSGTNMFYELVTLSLGKSCTHECFHKSFCMCIGANYDFLVFRVSASGSFLVCWAKKYSSKVLDFARSLRTDRIVWNFLLRLESRWNSGGFTFQYDVNFLLVWEK